MEEQSTLKLLALPSVLLVNLLWIRELVSQLKRELTWVGVRRKVPVKELFLGATVVASANNVLRRRSSWIDGFGPVNKLAF